MANEEMFNFNEVVCRFFVERGCKDGEHCLFPHILDGKRKPDNVCRYHLHNRCSFGEECRYDHVPLRKFVRQPLLQPITSFQQFHAADISPSARENSGRNVNNESTESAKQNHGGSDHCNRTESDWQKLQDSENCTGKYLPYVFIPSSFTNRFLTRGVEPNANRPCVARPQNYNISRVINTRFTPATHAFSYLHFGSLPTTGVQFMSFVPVSVIPCRPIVFSSRHATPVFPNSAEAFMTTRGLRSMSNVVETSSTVVDTSYFVNYRMEQADLYSTLSFSNVGNVAANRQAHVMPFLEEQSDFAPGVQYTTPGYVAPASCDLCVKGNFPYTTVAERHSDTQNVVSNSTVASYDMRRDTTLLSANQGSSAVPSEYPCCNSSGFVHNENFKVATSTDMPPISCLPEMLATLFMEEEKIQGSSLTTPVIVGDDSNTHCAMTAPNAASNFAYTAPESTATFPDVTFHESLNNFQGYQHDKNKIMPLNTFQEYQHDKNRTVNLNAFQEYQHESNGVVPFNTFQEYQDSKNKITSLNTFQGYQHDTNRITTDGASVGTYVMNANVVQREGCLLNQQNCVNSATAGNSFLQNTTFDKELGSINVNKVANAAYYVPNLNNRMHFQDGMTSSNRNLFSSRCMICHRSLPSLSSANSCMEEHMTPFDNGFETTFGEICGFCLRDRLSLNIYDLIVPLKNSASTPEDSSKEYVCSICLENILKKKNKSERRFGTLENCSHVFCANCISYWCRRGVLEKTIVGSVACKECGMFSSVIITSDVWIDGNAKAILVQLFKTMVSKTPCKSFDNGRGLCPFGDRCLFQHEMSSETQSCGLDQENP